MCIFDRLLQQQQISDQQPLLQTQVYHSQLPLEMVAALTSGLAYDCPCLCRALFVVVRMFLCPDRCGAADTGGHGEHPLLLTNLYATALGQHVVSDNDNKSNYKVE